jgi:surface polysaccharide O-acyltransferase-like enzyme
MLLNFPSISASQAMPQARAYWADLCRVIAIFGVIVIHACGEKFYRFPNINFSDWMPVNLLDSAVRCAVPIFVMLSGALLLPTGSDSVTLRQILMRSKKVLLPLLVWNIFYLHYVGHFSGQPINWLSMFYEPPMYHLWFVYMIVGLYLLLPLLQAAYALVVNRVSLQWYFLGLWLLVTVVPIYTAVPLLHQLQQTSLLGYGGYFLLGGILASGLRKNVINTWCWLAIYVGCVALTAYLTYSASVKANKVIETAYLYFSLNVFVASSAAFVLFLRVKIRPSLRGPLEWLSDKCFLIFFMHVIVLERVANYATRIGIDSVLPGGLGVLLIAFVTFLSCLMIATLLRSLPKSRTFLG